MAFTIPFIPNQGVKETLTWATETLETVNGTEQRLCLRDVPRRTITASFGPFEDNQQPRITEHVYAQFLAAGYVPLWQYFTPLTADAPSGAFVFSLNTTNIPIDIGSYLALIDLGEGTAETHEIIGVTPGVSVVTSTTSGADYAKRSVACPAIKVIPGTTKIAYDQITAEFSIKYDSFEDIPLVGGENVATLDTLSGIPILDKRAHADATESFETVNEIIDFSGARVQYTQYTMPGILKALTFPVDRLSADKEMDWWHVFLDTVKGGWKAFLWCTFQPDLIPGSTGWTALSTSISFEGVADHVQDNKAFQYIRVFYEDGTTSDFELTHDSAENFDIVGDALPDPLPDVSKVSFLLKSKLNDVVTLDHTGIRSIVSLELKATNYG